MLNNKSDKYDQDAGLGRLHARLDDHERRLTRVESRADGLEKEADRLDEAVGVIQETVAQIKEKLSSLAGKTDLQTWLLGVIVTAVLSSLILHLFGK
jgi:predicted nuclease with TOPRIM domain